jgi:hypothetical protein
MQHPPKQITHKPPQANTQQWHTTTITLQSSPQPRTTVEYSGQVTRHIQRTIVFVFGFGILSIQVCVVGIPGSLPGCVFVAMPYCCVLGIPTTVPGCVFVAMPYCCVVGIPGSCVLVAILQGIPSSCVLVAIPQGFVCANTMEAVIEQLYSAHGTNTTNARSQQYSSTPTAHCLHA